MSQRLPYLETARNGKDHKEYQTCEGQKDKYKYHITAKAQNSQLLHALSIRAWSIPVSRLGGSFLGIAKASQQRRRRHSLELHHHQSRSGVDTGSVDFYLYSSSCLSVSFITFSLSPQSAPRPPCNFDTTPQHHHHDDDLDFFSRDHPQSSLLHELLNMTSRKTQQEIEKTFKKVAEGIQAFEGIYEKIRSATNAAQRDKLEDNLKREIKKLQRFRDQIKSWAAGNEVKDKSPLLEQRRAIETVGYYHPLF